MTNTNVLRLAAGTVVLALLPTFGFTAQTDSIDLSGTWEFQLDPEDKGVSESWQNHQFSDTIQLPGSTSSNDKGAPVGSDTKWTGNFWLKTPEGQTWEDLPQYKPYLDSEEFRFPFWLIPEKHYLGSAWYQKEVVIPEDWEQGSIELFLERCHWETKIWIDDHYIASNNRLATPHRYDLSQHLSPGPHTLTIAVDNRIKDINPGLDAHSVTDNTQSNWNGIVGDIKLTHRPHVLVSSVQVFPNVTGKSAQVKIAVKNTSQSPVNSKIELRAILPNAAADAPVAQMTSSRLVPSGETLLEFTLPMGESILPWNEFEPNLYQVSTTVKTAKSSDTETVMFGMREIRADEDRIYLNDVPVFFRGTLECAIFPKTGYPPTDVEAWKRIIRICKDFGLNHIRFHSWCPPKAAFIAADELGFYFQVEASTWGAIGDGKPIDDWIHKETEAIIAEYGNHPSFVLMAYGNEPGGKNHKPYLVDYVKHWKPKDKRRLFTTGAGWPLVPENDFHSTHRGTRIQGWAQGLKSIINSEPPRSDYDWSDKMKDLTAPMISHEVGQWCVYPNFNEVPKYDGVLKPTNFEIFKRSLEANGMLHLADQFLNASGKLQTLCYKADIEAALRTPRYSGFQLLDLHDFPGQGTALVGVLDPFWDEKGYVTSDEFRRFCDTTVPLARFKKRVFKSGDLIELPVEVAHYGAHPLKNASATWSIKDEATHTLQSGTFPTRDIEIGHNIDLGQISTSVSLDKPAKLTLRVEVEDFENSWDLWVYPPLTQDTEQGIHITDQLDAETQRRLDQGETVLLSLGKGRVKEGKGGEVGIGFSSIFWNTAWTNGQKPHTLGILCDPQHPAFQAFPTEYHSNWQWWDAMSHSDAIRLDSFSQQIDPIVRVIDDWVTNRPLALVFECRIGKGSLIVSGIDLLNDLDTRLEASQLRHSLTRYAQSPDFAPAAISSIDEIKALLK